MKKLGVRISGCSSSSAVEIAITPLIFHNKNHLYLLIISSISYKVVLYRGVGAYLQSLKFNLKIWQILRKDCLWLKAILKKVAASRIPGNFW